jgi:penicillin-binding protein A
LKHQKKNRIYLFLAGSLLVGVFSFWIGQQVEKHRFLTKSEFQKLIAPNVTLEHEQFLTNRVQLAEDEGELTLDYSIDASLQLMAEQMFEGYRPDYGALVAVDAETGRVLAAASYDRAYQLAGNPVLDATLPAASVFKVITAAAAIEEQNLKPESTIEFSGRDHTLYRSNVLKEEVRGWRRVLTLKDAFARSINTVFGRLGIYKVGEESLISFSKRFGFDQPIPSEFEIEPSRLGEVKDKWGLAEVASGFTRNTTLSPIHGAMIAASIVNDGKMMEPYFIQSAMRADGTVIYRAEPKLLAQVVSPGTAGKLRELMNETIVSGTSRKSFRGFFKGTYRELDVGGKTGSLTANTPHGKVDWFVGYAMAQGRKIAVSVMTVHKKYWTVKSAYLARRTFEKAFEEMVRRKKKLDAS